MTFEMVLVGALVVISIVLFAIESFRVDLVALMIMGSLLLSGIITPEEGLAGFSNSATVTVAAMFVLSSSLFRSGAVNKVGDILARLFRGNYWVAIGATMLVVGVASAFINNTAVVALLIPVMSGVTRETGVMASKLLMPLSFASMFGGVCTLLGTSTNILVNSIAVRHGQERMGMFEFTTLGILFLAGGILYMLAAGIRLIPAHRKKPDLEVEYGMAQYLAEIVLLPKGKSVGSTVQDSPLVSETGIEILEIRRKKEHLRNPPAKTVLEAGDALLVVGDVEQIRQLQDRVGIRLQSPRPNQQAAVQMDEVKLVEAVIAPGSNLIGKTLKQLKFRDTYGVTAVAIRHHSSILHTRLSTTKLRPGDVLLLSARVDRLDELKRHEGFVFVSEAGPPSFRPSKMIPAIMIIVAVVVTAATGLLPIVVSAILGSLAIVLTGCLSLEEAYEAIEWQVIFLLAGVLTLGIALERTGVAVLVANTVIGTVGVWGPVAVLSAFYLITTLLSETMSNNASAALLAPIAISAAEAIGVSPRPFLFAVAFAASSSFMTPVGYQTNTMIYGLGHYSFADFFRVGWPLNLLFWIIATLAIPLIWPF